MRFLLSFFTILLAGGLATGQTLNWTTHVDTVRTMSSPHGADLTTDGTIDFVVGTETTNLTRHHGVVAMDGTDGSVLWEVTTKAEIFGSAAFTDVTGDLVPDVFIGGRNAEFYGIDGATGSVLWEFFPYGPPINPADSGWYNFYSAQIIPDQNSDLVNDILVANGGDNSLAPWDSVRPPGHLMVLDGVTGAILAKAVVPDSAETYCSPVVSDLYGTGTLYVVFGTGGETFGGSMWVAELSEVMAEDLTGAVEIANTLDKGYIAPASIGDLTGDGKLDIVIQAYDGTISLVDGSGFTPVWSVPFAGTESSAEPVIGNFTGDITPDVFGVLYQGVAPSFFDYYQVMIDGATGNVVFQDSIGDMHFVSANAYDTNGDGRDEALITVTHFGFTHELQLIDFQNSTTSSVWGPEPGTNLACTPWIGDADGNDTLDMVYVKRSDPGSPMAWEGIDVTMLGLGLPIPNAGIAWGSYLGTLGDGHYTYTVTDCGTGSIVSVSYPENPSCNGLSDGHITVNPSNGTAPFTYLWSDGSVGDSIGGLSPGSYSLLITDATGCSESLNYLISDPYFISFGAVFAPTCPGDTNGTATVNSSGCPCMFSLCEYLWDDGDTIKTTSDRDSGWAVVIITHEDGCIVEDSVYIPASLSVADTVLFEDISCYGEEDARIKVIGSYPSILFDWSNGETTGMIDSLPAGNYSVAIEDHRVCYDTLYFTVTEPDSLIMNYTLTHVSCEGFADGQIDLSAIGGTMPYYYVLNDSAYSTSTFMPLDTGSYEIMIADTNGCVSDSVIVTITQPTPLSLSMGSTPETATGWLDGTATATPGGGTTPYTYLWNDPSSQTTNPATGLATGDYIVIVTDANGCTITDTVTVSSTNFIDEHGNPVQITYFPNPASDELFISLQRTGTDPFDVLLHDVRGRKVGTWGAIQDDLVRIETGHLERGYYVLSIVYGDHTEQLPVILQ